MALAGGVCNLLQPPLRNFPWIYFVSGGSLLLSFIHGLFEGAFVLFLLIAAHRSRVWEDFWLHLPLLRCLWAVFQASCFCFQVRFNQTRILNSCYSKDGPRRSSVSITWQLVRNAGSGATQTNEPDLVLKEPQCFMGTFMSGSAVCVTPYLSQLWP